jgi:hypothetical protein
MGNGLDLAQEEWDVLEALAAEDGGVVVADEELLARLEAFGLLERSDGRPELTPEARLKLASRHLLHG